MLQIEIEIERTKMDKTLGVWCLDVLLDVLNFRK